MNKNYNESLGEQLEQHAITSQVAEIMRQERKEQARLINERDEAREVLREWRKAWRYIPKDQRKHFIVAANRTDRVLKGEALGIQESLDALRNEIVQIDAAVDWADGATLKTMLRAALNLK